MGKYTAEEVEILKQSPYIKSVSQRSVQYGDLFRDEFYMWSQKGFDSKEIFRILGLDTEIIGDTAIHSFVATMSDYQPRLDETGKPINMVQIMLDQEKEIKRLSFENQFLKKKRAIDLGILPTTNKPDSTLK